MPATKKPKFEIPMLTVMPTAKFANVQPLVTGIGETFEEARDDAIKKAQSFYSVIEAKNEFGPVTLDMRNQTQSTIERQLMKCFVSGTEAYFDETSHTYITAKGEKYISGSTFSHQFEHEFNKGLIVPKSAVKLGLREDEVEAYWQSKGDISTTFGTSLHQALEHYGKWQDVCEADVDSKTGQSKGTGIHPTLEPIVLAFFEKFGHERAVYEPFVADERNLRCGQIDRLVITGEKRCIIDDYKTNGDLYKKGIPATLKAPYAYLPNVPMSKYMIQLSFYKAILEAHGWTVEGLRIHHWAGTEWHTIPIKSVEIDAKQEPIDVSKIL